MIGTHRGLASELHISLAVYRIVGGDLTQLGIIMDKLRHKALRHCANWDAGKCSGCMIKCELDGTIRLIIDKKKYKKDCNPVDCQYFENTVQPGIVVRR